VLYFYFKIKKGVRKIDVRARVEQLSRASRRLLEVIQVQRT
jgi:hypothetical protein